MRGRRRASSSESTAMGPETLLETDRCRSRAQTLSRRKRQCVGCRLSARDSLCAGKPYQGQHLRDAPGADLPPAPPSDTPDGQQAACSAASPTRQPAAAGKAAATATHLSLRDQHAGGPGMEQLRAAMARAACAAQGMSGLAADMAVAGQYVAAATQGAVDGSPVSALIQGVLVRSRAVAVP